MLDIDAIPAKLPSFFSSEPIQKTGVAQLSPEEIRQTLPAVSNQHLKRLESMNAARGIDGSMEEEQRKVSPRIVCSGNTAGRGDGPK